MAELQRLDLREAARLRRPALGDPGSLAGAAPATWRLSHLPVATARVGGPRVSC